MTSQELSHTNSTLLLLCAGGFFADITALKSLSGKYRKNSCTGFHIILLQRKLFQPRRSSVFLPWNAMEAFFWVGIPTSTTHCASLGWHFARTALLIVQTNTIQRLQTRSRLLVLHCICIIEVNGLALAEREFESWTSIASNTFWTGSSRDVTSIIR